MILDDENILIKEASDNLTSPFMFLLELVRDKGDFLNKLDNSTIYDNVFNMLKAICSQDTIFELDKFHIDVFKYRIIINYKSQEILRFSLLENKIKIFLNIEISYYNNLRGVNMFTSLMKIYRDHFRKLGALYSGTSIIIAIDK